MTTKRIVYSRPDGGVSIVSPAPSFISSLVADDFMTEDEAIAVIQANDVPDDATNVEVMKLTQIPTDRTFRDAWEKGQVGLTTNLVKSLEIAKTNIRREREPKLEELDVLAIQADEAGDSAGKAAIAVKKNIARNATNDLRLSDAQSEAELKLAMEIIQAEIRAL